MIELNENQRQNLRQGMPIRVPVPEMGADCVVLLAHDYERLCGGENGPDMREVAALIERNMRDDDANDPLLESYQETKP